MGAHRRGGQVERVDHGLERGGLAQQRKVRLVRQQAQQDKVGVLPGRTTLRACGGACVGRGTGCKACICVEVPGSADTHLLSTDGHRSRGAPAAFTDKTLGILHQLARQQPRPPARLPEDDMSRVGVECGQAALLADEAHNLRANRAHARSGYHSGYHYWAKPGAPSLPHLRAQRRMQAGAAPALLQHAAAPTTPPCASLRLAVKRHCAYPCEHPLRMATAQSSRRAGHAHTLCSPSPGSPASENSTCEGQRRTLLHHCSLHASTRARASA